MEEGRVLESWKEISSYLNRSEKTCQRWETELGLPIHRLDGTPKAHVFAYTNELNRWLAERSHGEEAPAKAAQAAKHKWLWPALAAAGLIVAVTAFLLWRDFLSPPPPVPEAKPWLAIINFENPGDDESLRAWERALPLLLTLDLEQSRYIHVGGASTPADLEKVAKRRKIDYVLRGALTKAGRDIVATTTVEKYGTAEPAKSIQAVGQGEEDLMTKVDSVTRAVKSAMGLSARHVARDEDADIVKITTPSPEAFKLFCLGFNPPPADTPVLADPLAKAVEIDPEFALGFRNLYFFPKRERERNRKSYLSKAFELSGRLARNDRLLTRGDYYYEIKEDWDKAAGFYQDLLDLDPDQWPAQVRLTALHISREDWDKAIPVLERSTGRSEPGNALDDTRLALCYAAKGWPEKAGQVLDDFISRSPMGLRRIGIERLLVFFLRNDFAGARQFMGRMFPPDAEKEHAYWRGLAGYLEDDFTTAEREFQAYLMDADGRPDSRYLDGLKTVYLARGKIEAAQTLLATGLERAGVEKTSDYVAGFNEDLAYICGLSDRSEKAARAIDAACETQRRMLEETTDYRRYIEREYPYYLQLLHERALVTLGAGDMKTFEIQAEELRRLIEQKPLKKLIRRYYHLLGEREAKRLNYAAAVEYFDKAMAMLPAQNPRSETDLSRYYFSLAEACQSSGDLARARETYEKLIRLCKSEPFDAYARSFYRLGRVCEQMGDVGKAKESYRKFLELWEGADRMFSEVDDAKARLAALGP